jgi:hypothetical protein
MIEDLDANSIDCSFVSNQIPYVMNALYNENSLESVTLEEIRDAFRLKQVQSKSWMMSHISQLDKSKSILVIGSWLGFTSFCLSKLGFTNITETDPDSRLSNIANHLNRSNKHFKHLDLDVNNLDNLNYDIVINTSCEHIDNNEWFQKVPTDTVMVLHSNNLEGYDHVNCCTDIADMIGKYPMDLIYAGSLDLVQYKRFMLIGRKK